MMLMEKNLIPKSSIGLLLETKEKEHSRNLQNIFKVGT